MKVLELFAGSRSVGRAAEALGMRVFSSDLVAFDGIDYPVDILDFDPSAVPFRPDIIWASPPCTSFSVAAMGHHWHSERLPGGMRTYEAKTDGARLGVRLVERTLEIIEHFAPAHWFIENPRGLLRKMPQMRGLNRHTVTYCQYGDDRMKPTDIWTNSRTWVPRPACRNGDGCHEAAPRGSRTGTQGRKGAYDRSKIPDLLCEELLRSCIP
jgi:site-specific DNA-cytosine methylase